MANLTHGLRSAEGPVLINVAHSVKGKGLCARRKRRCLLSYQGCRKFDVATGGMANLKHQCASYTGFLARPDRRQARDSNIVACDRCLCPAEQGWILCKTASPPGVRSVGIAGNTPSLFRGRQGEHRAFKPVLPFDLNIRDLPSLANAATTRCA